MSNLNILRQPKPFYLIFSIEFWERFGFYGMQAILAVYLVRVLGMSESESFALFGAFSSLVYGFVAVGGWLGDKVIGTKRAITVGALVLMLGYLLLGLSTNEKMGGSPWIYVAMGFITVGNGLFKANPSSLLSKVYERNDPRLDGAFTLYYMAVNVGSLFSMLVTPLVAEKAGYSLAFGVSAIGLAITIVNFLVCLRILDGVGSSADLKPVRKKTMISVLLSSTLMGLLCSHLLRHLYLVHSILILAATAILSYYFKEVVKSEASERKKMLVALILMLQGVVFFVLYFQMPTSLNFFAIHNVKHEILGLSIQPEQFQALNPFWIMVASPILAMLCSRLGEKFSMPLKFAVGMILCALSFLILYWGSTFANAEGFISSNWLVLSYFFQSVGELLVSGLGLAMVAHLVPQRMMGFTMGMWFLTSAAAALIGGWVATLMSVPVDITDTQQSLAIYRQLFSEIGCITAVISVFTLLAAPALGRICHDRKR